MIIFTDKVGRNAIEQLCDIALKEAGVKNLDAVNTILASVKLIEAAPKKDVSKADTKPKSNPVDVKKEVQPKTEKVEKKEKVKKKKNQGSLSVDKIRRKPGPRKK